MNVWKRVFKFKALNLEFKIQKVYFKKFKKHSLIIGTIRPKDTIGILIKVNIFILKCLG